MGAWPQILEGQLATDYGTTTASSTATLITASGTTHTKGSWSQLVASTTSDHAQLLVTITKLSALGSVLVDIGIGAAASEVALIPNISYRAPSSVASMMSRFSLFQIAVPAGSRLSARSQGTAASITCQVQVIGFS